MVNEHKLLLFLSKNKLTCFLLHVYFRVMYGKNFAGTLFGIPMIKSNLGGNQP